MAKEDQLVFEISAIDTASKVFNQVGAAAKNLQTTYSSLQSVFATAVTVLAIDKVVDATIEWERASNRMTATLRATGNAVGLSRRELDDLAVSMSKTTEFSERQITNAEAQLISFGGMHQDVFKGALKDTADLAAKMGTDLVSAAHLVGRAYQDPILGLRGFQKELGTLTFSEKEYIAQLEANGHVEEAQLAIHDLIQRKIGGTAELMNTGLTKAVKDNQKAWEELETSIGNWAKGGLVGSANAISGWVKGVQDMIALARSGNLSLNPNANRAAVAGGTSRGASGSWGTSEAEENLAAAAAADKAADAENRRREAHAKAVPVLKSWTAQLSETTKTETAMTLILEGEAKSWNKADQAKLLAIAHTMDMRKVNETYVVGLKEYFDAQEKANGAQTSFNDITSAAQIEAEFQITLIGKTTVEQEKLTAARRIELEAIAKQGEINAELFPEQFRAISQAAKDALGISGDLIDRRRKLERDWATGTKTTFDDYIDHATNAAEQANFVFTNAFKNLEDAEVQFAMTGKTSFRSFADSVISDIARIQFRQLNASIAGGTSSFFQGLFGSGASGSATVPVSHAGGVIGVDSFPTRSVDSSIFAGAPRYHLGVDEVPAILQRGETVLPKGAKGGGIYYIDARGADGAGMARLEAMIRKVNGSVEYRAVGAVQRAYNQRGMSTPMG